MSVRAHLHFLMEFDRAIKGPEELSLSYPLLSAESSDSAWMTRGGEGA